VSEQSPLVVLALIASGLAGALQSILQWERQSEQHCQAAFRYADLLSDAEEVLCKERTFRPSMDITIQRFKMRMDSAERYSPSVSIPSVAISCSSRSESEGDPERSELTAAY
jgi:hypothetical protein